MRISILYKLLSSIGLRRLPILALPLCTSASAHVGSTQGWLHPLTGLDHLLAMVSVGAWSSQIGGRAIWFVPSAFVIFMFFGGLAGFEQIELPAVEVGVALSVVILGLAIAFAKRLPIVFASAAVGTFGVFHGYAHGYEMPVMEDKLVYVSGFLATTATLHLIGAVGAHFALKHRNGAIGLRGAGAISAVCGLYLTYIAVRGG